LGAVEVAEEVAEEVEGDAVDELADKSVRTVDKCGRDVVGE
jgi:hypothetical protein